MCTLLLPFYAYLLSRFFTSKLMCKNSNSFLCLNLTIFQQSNLYNNFLITSFTYLFIYFEIFLKRTLNKLKDEQKAILIQKIVMIGDLSPTVFLILLFEFF